VTFKPDSEIFKGTEFSFEIPTQRLRELSYLNRGLADPVARAPTDPKVVVMVDIAHPWSPS
jgi:DNA gyrase/topoisomerase IV subunit B